MSVLLYICVVSRISSAIMFSSSSSSSSRRRRSSSSSIASLAQRPRHLHQYASIVEGFFPVEKVAFESRLVCPPMNYVVFLFNSKSPHRGAGGQTQETPWASTRF